MPGRHLAQTRNPCAKRTGTLDPVAGLHEKTCMKATVTEDGRHFTLQRGAWSNTYPIEDLAKWLAFYRQQPLDFPKSGTNYAASITALESLCRARGLI